MAKEVRPASGRHFRGTLLELIALVRLVLQTRREVLEKREERSSAYETATGSKEHRPLSFLSAPEAACMRQGKGWM